MNDASHPQPRKLGVLRPGASTALAWTFVLALTALAIGSANAQTYTEKILYKFTGVPDGVGPEGGLVLDAQGALYGTTVNGGSGSCASLPGCGSVFKVDTSGNESVLHSFAGGTDGEGPVTSTLVRDAQGNLYGTTLAGGSIPMPPSVNAYGTVFKIDTTGNESVLFPFQTQAQGKDPEAGLILDSQGNLYGTTFDGGIICTVQGAAAHCSTVFKVDPTGKETVLYNFTATNGDGANPGGGLVRDAQGNLYGVTSNGGNACPVNGVQYGCGTVFKVDPTGAETVLYSFTSTNGDGTIPEEGLILDAQGNLYGTTNLGGSGTCGAARPGCGTIFKVDSTGKETVLHSFTGADGAFPTAGLLLDAQGNLYGTTYGGGGTNCQLSGVVIGCGTVFKLDPTGKETVLYAFTGTGGDGFAPYASNLIQDTRGNLYGTTQGGGISGSIAGTSNGTVFELLITQPSLTLGSSTSLSMSRGATTNNTVTIPVTPGGGFTGNVTLSAAITSSPAGAQLPPTFSFGSTSPVHITSATPGTATLTISTTAATSAALASPSGQGMLWYGVGSAAIFGCAMFFNIPNRGRGRNKLGFLLLIVLFFGALPGCGGGAATQSTGGGGGGGTGSPGTTPGSYTVTVTATSASITAMQTINLTVQ